MNIFKKKSIETPKSSDRQRLRELLVRELILATDFEAAICEAFRRGERVKITIQVDDVEMPVGVLARANEPLIEYLANWAVAEKLKKLVRLDEFDRQGRGVAEGIPEMNALGAKSDDQTEWEGGWPKKWRG